MRTTISLIALAASLFAFGPSATARELDDAAMIESKREAAPLPRAHDERVTNVKSDSIVPAKYEASYPTRDAWRLRHRGSI